MMMIIGNDCNTITLTVSIRPTKVPILSSRFKPIGACVSNLDDLYSNCISCCCCSVRLFVFVCLQLSGKPIVSAVSIAFASSVHQNRSHCHKSPFLSTFSFSLSFSSCSVTPSHSSCCCSLLLCSLFVYGYPTSCGGATEKHIRIKTIFSNRITRSCGDLVVTQSVTRSHPFHSVVSTTT